MAGRKTGALHPSPHQEVQNGVVFPLKIPIWNSQRHVCDIPIQPQQVGGCQEEMCCYSKFEEGA